ncbi:MAG: DUF883 C-terminal domain-containing protein [Verrucomicrobiota bacterium]
MTSEPDAPLPLIPATRFESMKERALKAAGQLRASAGSSLKSWQDSAARQVENIRRTAAQRSQPLTQPAMEAANEFNSPEEPPEEPAADSFSQYAEQAREHAQTYWKQAEDYIRENPTKGALIALGAGFVLGSLFRR